MSEFSESFHIRSTSRRAVAEAMRRADIQGVLFPPKNGWCTTVPFEGDDPSLEVWSSLFRVPVLRYFFAADHGWGIALAVDGNVVSRFETYWAGQTTPGDRQLNFSALKELFLPKADTVRLEAALRGSPAAGAEPDAIAYSLAQALGLPRFRWLSPAYVTADFKRGSLPKTATVIGAPDPDPELPRPSISSIKLHRSDLSALDVLEALSPHIVAWDPSACADLVQSDGDFSRRDTDGPLISSAGRTTAHGAWSVRYVSKANNVIVFATLNSSGVVAIKPLLIGLSTELSRLPPQWVDSTRLLALTEPLFEARRHRETPPVYDRVLKLNDWGKNNCWNWMVHYLCLRRGGDRWDLNVTVDALTGDVLTVDERAA